MCFKLLTGANLQFSHLIYKNDPPKQIWSIHSFFSLLFYNDCIGPVVWITNIINSTIWFTRINYHIFSWSINNSYELDSFERFPLSQFLPVNQFVLVIHKFGKGNRIFFSLTNFCIITRWSHSDREKPDTLPHMYYMESFRLTLID